MRRAFLNTIGGVAACVLQAGLLCAQAHMPGSHLLPPTPPATVQVTTDMQKIFIGQPIRLTLEATVPDNVAFVWPVIDSMPHFERLDSGRIDTTICPGNDTTGST